MKGTAAWGVVEALGGDAMQLGQIQVQNDLLTSDRQTRRGVSANFANSRAPIKRPVCLFCRDLISSGLRS